MKKAEQVRGPAHQVGGFVRVGTEDQQRQVLEDDGKHKGDDQGIHVIPVGGADERALHQESEEKHKTDRHDHGKNGGQAQGGAQMVAEVAGEDVHLPVGEIHHFHDSHDEGHADRRDGVDHPDHDSVGHIHQEFSHGHLIPG